MKTILLFGGNSEERFVSVASAQNISEQYSFSHLYYQKFNEELVEVTKSELLSHKDVFKSEFRPNGKSIAKNLNEGIELFKGSIVFLGYHGSQGENGQVQSLFENHKIFFTGSGSLASKQAFEKDLGKKIISKTNIKLAEQLVIPVKDLLVTKEPLRNFLKQHGKIALKPTSSGSSFGLHFLSHESQLDSVVEKIISSGFETYLAERFLQGRELTVAVVDHFGILKAMPASEVILDEGHAFDYDGKYLGTGSKEITPAKLTPDELKAAQNLALEAHRAFGCYGYSRTDMILTEQGPYFLETNTLPGLSKPSFVPQQLLAGDITFKSFIEAQIKLAEKRYAAN